MGIASIAAKALGYGKRVANIAPEFLLGTGAEAVGKGMKNAKGSLWSKLKAGGKSLEADVIAKKAAKGGFFKRTLKELISTPKALLSGGKAGARAAKIAGKSASWGAVKGVGKAIAKRMPMIGAVLTLAIEAPTIYKSFKEGGFKAGLKECAGVGTELGCMAAGAAIGSVIPGVGTVIGGLVGGIVGMFARSTLTPTKPEAEQQEGQPVEYSKEDINALRSIGLTDEEIQALQANGYTIEDIEKTLNQEYKNELIAPQDNTRVVNPYQQDIQAEIAALETENQALRKQLELSQYTGQQLYENTQNNNQFSYFNPYMFNPYVNGLNNNTNSYANDMLYQQLFGQNLSFNPYLQQNQYPNYKFAG